MQFRSVAWTHGHMDTWSVTQVKSNVTRAARMQLCSVAWTHGHMVTQIESNVVDRHIVSLSYFINVLGVGDGDCYR
jgi:hypothetical protein